MTEHDIVLMVEQDRRSESVWERLEQVDLGKVHAVWSRYTVRAVWANSPTKPAWKALAAQNPTPAIWFATARELQAQDSAWLREQLGEQR